MHPRARVKKGGAKELDQRTFERLLDLCATSLMDGPFQPLSDSLNDRMLKIVEQTEYLVEFFNENGAREVPSDWTDRAIRVTQEDMFTRLRLFETMTDERFQQQPTFIYSMRQFAQRNEVIQNFLKTISNLQTWPFFHNFLYKLSMNAETRNVEEIDRHLESSRGTRKYHEEIYFPLQLQKAADVMTSNFFCKKCGMGFTKAEAVFSHCAKVHVGFVNEEVIEEMKSARETRRNFEIDLAHRCRHTELHPDCIVCFPVPQ